MDPLAPDVLDVLADTGPAGVIFLLATAVILFMRGNIRRGREVDEWKEIADRATETVAALVPTVERLTESVEAMFEAQEAQHKEAELRMRIEREMDGGS